MRLLVTNRKIPLDYPFYCYIYWNIDIYDNIRFWKTRIYVIDERHQRLIRLPLIHIHLATDIGREGVPVPYDYDLAVRDVGISV